MVPIDGFQIGPIRSPLFAHFGNVGIQKGDSPKTASLIGTGFGTTFEKQNRHRATGRFHYPKVVHRD